MVISCSRLKKNFPLWVNNFFLHLCVNEDFYGLDDGRAGCKLILALASSLAKLGWHLGRPSVVLHFSIFTLYLTSFFAFYIFSSISIFWRLLQHFRNAFQREKVLNSIH